MITAVYVPLWVPAAVICVLCLIPDLVTVPARCVCAVRRWRDGRLVDRLWADYEVRQVGGGRSSYGGRRPVVATTAPAAADDFGDAA